jgi:hypothetical protein
MVAPFGFGVGDIIQGIILIVDGVKALDNAKGAKKSYREFVECLTSLLDNFVALDNLDLPEQLEQSKKRIRSRVARIRRIISEFVATTKKYQRHLSEPGLSWTDGIKKIQWQLCKKQDLDSFHEGLRQENQDLLTCLVLVNTYVPSYMQYYLFHPVLYVNACHDSNQLANKSLVRWAS